MMPDKLQISEPKCFSMDTQIVNQTAFNRRDEIRIFA